MPASSSGACTRAHAEVGAPASPPAGSGGGQSNRAPGRCAAHLDHVPWADPLRAPALPRMRAPQPFRTGARSGRGARARGRDRRSSTQRKSQTLGERAAYCSLGREGAAHRGRAARAPDNRHTGASDAHSIGRDQKVRHSLRRRWALRNLTPGCCARRVAVDGNAERLRRGRQRRYSLSQPGQKSWPRGSEQWQARSSL
jgi:hypothetical protein